MQDSWQPCFGRFEIFWADIFIYRLIENNMLAIIQSTKYISQINIFDFVVLSTPS